MKRTINTVLPLLLSLLVAAGLVNNSIFGEPTLAAYLYCTLGVSIVIMFFGAAYIVAVHRNTQLTGGFTIHYALPLWLFTTYTLYLFLQVILLPNAAVNNWHRYILALFLLFFVCSLMAGSNNFRTKLYYGISYIAGAEAIVCILQWFGVIFSMHPYFEVTGTNTNTNVTAMFLAMAFPAICYMIKVGKRPHKIAGIIILVLVLVALILLQCRTAFLGVLVSSMVLLNAQYCFFQRIWNGKHKWLKGSIALIALVMVGIFLVFIYTAKKESADGRRLIWKVSTHMIQERPAFGYGYGRFERDYNIAQADYFAYRKASGKEINNASFVRMAYNEFLQHAVEGGGIGVLLFMLFGLSLLLHLPSKNDITNAVQKQNMQHNTTGKNNQSIFFENMVAYAGIVAFAVMSMVNFTLQAIPVACLFIIYAAIATSWKSKITTQKLAREIKITRPWALFTAGIIILFGIIFFSNQYTLARAYYQNRKAMEYAKKKDITNALKILIPLEDKLSQSDLYYTNLSSTLIRATRYSEAIVAMEKATNLTSNPDLFLLLGDVYKHTGQYEKAMHVYKLAEHIVPNRMAPKYKQMQWYISRNDTLGAVNTANLLLHIQAKGVSSNAEVYKQEAQKVIDIYQ